MTWQTRRAKRVAIDRAEIRRRSRRLGPFMAGARTARLVNEGIIDEILSRPPHKPGSQEAIDWENGYNFQLEEFDAKARRISSGPSMETRIEQADAPEKVQEQNPSERP